MGKSKGKVGPIGGMWLRPMPAMFTGVIPQGCLGRVKGDGSEVVGKTSSRGRSGNEDGRGRAQLWLGGGRCMVLACGSFPLALFTRWYGFVLRNFNWSPSFLDGLIFFPPVFGKFNPSVDPSLISHKAAGKHTANALNQNVKTGKEKKTASKKTQQATTITRQSMALQTNKGNVY